MRSRLTTLAAVFLLVAVSCGSSDANSVAANETAREQPTADSAQDSSPADTEPGANPTSDSTTGNNNGPDSGGSPLEQLLGVPLNDDAAMQRFYQELDREAETATAECMINQGFEFIPNIQSVSELDAAGLSEDSVEFAEKFGFGITFDINVDDLESSGRQENKNDAYLASLTDNERQAYELALWGDHGDEQEINNDGPGEMFGGGCYGESYEAAYAKSPDQVFNALESELMGIIGQFYADPRILAVQEDYAECMATAGYDYQNADQAKVDVARKLGEIVSLESSFEDPFGPDERSTVEMGWNEESIQFEVRGNTLTADAQELLDDVTKIEFTTALVSAECLEPLRPVELDVQYEYEQRLVDEFGDQVRAIQGEG